MSVLRALAPAKINLGLFLGPARAGDARHELVTVMQSISLADELTLEPAPTGARSDEVLCPGVEGEENLAAAALRLFRQSTGWQAPPLRLSIVKRIPVAAGLGGGSADAAATLRLARRASGLGEERLLLALATELGADVPAQLSPGRWLASGAGERLLALAPPSTPFGVLVLPGASGLSTAAVYREADRLGLARTQEALQRTAGELLAALEHGTPLPGAVELLHNDLQAAAASLSGEEIATALREAHAAGADVALLSGSGPTVLGLFAAAAGSPEAGGEGRSGPERAELAAARLRGRVPAPMFAAPVEAAFAAAVELERTVAREG